MKEPSPSPTRCRPRRIPEWLSKSFKPDDKVEWDHSQGTTQGRVVRTQTSPTKIKGHKVAASKDNPEYVVKSDKTGALAPHKPEELRRR